MGLVPKKSLKSMLDMAGRQAGDCVHAQSSTRLYEIAIHRLVQETIVVLFNHGAEVAQYSTRYGLTFEADDWPYADEFVKAIEERIADGKPL